MASVKIILRKEEKADGTYPLAIRITKDRKSSYIYLEYSVLPEYWDSKTQRIKKSHPNSVRLNNLLLKKLAEANDKAIEVETQKDFVTSKAVRQKIKPTAGQTFFPQAEVFLKQLKEAGKYNQYTSDKGHIKNFRQFIGEDIAFQDITPSLLERFKSFLMGQRKISERTAVNNLVTIRSVFSHAIKDNIVDARHYPFGKGKTKIKFPDSIKIGLTLEEIKQLEEVELTEEQHNHARNLFLFSFYFAGMRVSDVFRLRWSDFQNDRLFYAMGKNTKAGSLKIPEKALGILKQYEAMRDDNEGLVFPDLKGQDFSNRFLTQRRISFRVSAVAKILRLHVAPKAGIEKKLTMHIARHTFGNISGDRIPIQMLQKLYRHSSITTTIGYQQNFIHKDADEALDAVINGLDKPKP